MAEFLRRHFFVSNPQEEGVNDDSSDYEIVNEEEAEERRNHPFDLQQQQEQQQQQQQLHQPTLIQHLEGGLSPETEEAYVKCVRRRSGMSIQTNRQRFHNSSALRKNNIAPIQVIATPALFNETGFLPSSSLPKTSPSVSEHLLQEIKQVVAVTVEDTLRRIIAEVMEENE